eukprot:6520609-Pyramimonas_sp.AAC.2
MADLCGDSLEPSPTRPVSAGQSQGAKFQTSLSECAAQIIMSRWRLSALSRIFSRLLPRHSSTSCLVRMHYDLTGYN